LTKEDDKKGIKVFYEKLAEVGSEIEREVKAQKEMQKALSKV
jgi:hypothetical protein